MKAKAVIYLNRCRDCGWQGESKELAYVKKWDAFFCPVCMSEEVEEFATES